MNKHTESIIVFGLVLPGVVIMALLGATFFVRGKLKAAEEEKLQVYRDHEQVVAALQKAESEFGERRANLEYWQESVQKELIQSVTSNLRVAMQEFTDDQIRQTELSRPPNTSKLASVTENEYDRFLLGFEAGFGPMQRVLAELETHMPQLVLESLTIGPGTQPAGDGGARRLKFVATYLSWRDSE